MNLVEHYRNLFLQYGDSPEASQWRDRETQENRFAILTEIADLHDQSILDFGCGTGHLANYLKSREISVNYTGVDIVSEVLQCGQKKYPEFRFCQMDEITPSEKFDYVLISGVFNNLVENNRLFYQSTLTECFSRARKGLAFNLLSHYVDYYDQGLFYEYPEVVFKFAKEHLSPYVVLRNDYQLKPGIIPFEFTTYIYRR
ncbi:class I SAM-dependent methyltransferase [Alkalinema sp. FACHB-956]|uniref:class I SAM-dependent methyltransferase n=1 Tax=Alkalinema sp. FACHB-956 TaxID=2692768 RepID=UPI0016834F41|nr:class I SAM-dependent methyltransferase [Alkalinema sp. FACHB-956]MBD2327193.1 class I SAM-dependent methyltransferase [Alkalinema sp. FACHB-956]